jgi:hypothetical protein
MSWNLNQFRKNITSIGLNQYFKLDFTGVEQLISSYNSDKITALCRSTELPAKTIETQNVPYYGADYKIGSKATFNDWTVTFLEENPISSFGALRDELMEWSELIYDVPKLKVENDHISYKTDAVTVAKVTPNDYASSIIRFYGLFPSTVGPLNFDQNGGTALTFDVTFTYDFFIKE